MRFPYGRCVFCDTPEISASFLRFISGDNMSPFHMPTEKSSTRMIWAHVQCSLCWMQMRCDLKMTHQNTWGYQKWLVIFEGPEFEWRVVIPRGDRGPVLLPLPLDLIESKIKQNWMVCTLMSHGARIQFGCLSLGASSMHILKISHELGL